jgi:energy-coupling factor transport system permease protein
MILHWHIIRLWVLISLAALLAGILLAPAPTLADDELHHAGLVVRDAEGRLTYAWVPFAEEEIDGIDLLRRSGIPVVAIGFGALGEGVCSIAGQGCGVAECRRTVCQGSAADAPYWQYFQQDPSDPAVWTWQPLGASSSAVENGDVFGWSWTASDPALPALPPLEIARLAGAVDEAASEPVFRTIVPDGVATLVSAPPPDARTTAAAAAILVVIAASAMALAVWRREWNEEPIARREPLTPTPRPLQWARGWGEGCLSSHCSRPLDPRAWIIWAVAANLPPLVGRNPWPLAATLLAVLGVWAACSTGAAGARWRPLLRLALVFGAVSVLFNLLTAHIGDRIIGALPESWPVIGGVLTLNALLYGLLSAMAIFSLVTVGATLGATLDWSATMRLLPERMAVLAVAGSVAWAYLPRTTAALIEIREAQMARGFRPRGLRDAAPLVIPLLAGGLERAMITAEALEARAFGAPLAPEPTSWSWQGASLLGGLVAALTGAFCLALGQLAVAGVLLAAAAAALMAGLVTGGRSERQLRRTRYRDPVWERPEWTVSGAAITVLAVEIVVLFLDPSAFRYEPYPSLTAPVISLPLLAALGLLLVPAAVRP